MFKNIYIFVTMLYILLIIEVESGDLNLNIQQNCLHSIYYHQTLQKVVISRINNQNEINIDFRLRNDKKKICYWIFVILRTIIEYIVLHIIGEISSSFDFRTINKPNVHIYL